MNEETLFHLARQKPVGERSAFLDEACAGDVELRRRVEILLQAHEATGNPLDRPPLEPATQARKTPDREYTWGSEAESPTLAPDERLPVDPVARTKVRYF